MKKTLLCNLKMKMRATKTIYVSEDKSIPVSSTEVRYPVTGFFEKTLTKEDDVTAILIVKRDENGETELNIRDCKDELDEMARKTGARLQYKMIYTEYKETISTHEKLFLDIIEALDENAHITVDMTYGPKDLPIVLFGALNFAEKYLNCDIDNIMYGQVDFIDGVATNTRICEMAPLYYLNRITSTVDCGSSQEAKKMLDLILNR